MSACVFFFLEPVGPSVSKPARLSNGCSAHCHQVQPVSLSVSLQASWVRRRLISCMLAVGTTARMHAAEAAVERLGTPCVHKRSYWNMCAKENGGRKFFLFEFGMFDMSIESLPAFSSSNSLSYSFFTPLPFFFLFLHRDYCKPGTGFFLSDGSKTLS